MSKPRLEKCAWASLPATPTPPPGLGDEEVREGKGGQVTPRCTRSKRSSQSRVGPPKGGAGLSSRVSSAPQSCLFESEEELSAWRKDLWVTQLPPCPPPHFSLPLRLPPGNSSLESMPMETEEPVMTRGRGGGGAQTRPGCCRQSLDRWTVSG